MKEWSAITEALARGWQIALLRKGGIVEAARDGFRLRHREFVLFPTHEHEQMKMLRPERAELVQPPSELIPIRVFAQVVDVLRAPASHGLLLGDDFVWNEAFLKQRYCYRPDLPLWLLVIRAYRLPETVWIPSRSSYAGCKSWVNLTEEIDVTAAAPVLSEAEFAQRWSTLKDKLGAPDTLNTGAP
ncbi:MAG: DUF1802 family protein [Bryobacteraceae bacterium]|nr:DUF1802 family protein [Bryobacteraceae bacterium]MDW8377301.1 DUF1802 family protein [Bryobacterales bacterium]